MKRSILCAVILLLAVSAGPGFAQEQGQVVLETVIQREVEVVTDEGEKEIRLVEVANAVPGDELIFTVSYTNTGSEPASNVNIVNPIPENTTYIQDTAAGEGTAVTFSADGGSSYGLPGELKVIGPDGKQRQALLEDYTHIRWVRERALTEGEAGSVAFRVKLK